jgi:RNA ligase
MHYTFPEIRTIHDVLPHIEGRSEFIVAEREFGTVINYVVAMSDTFNMEGPDDIGGAIRRECRGLIFDTDGNIMSRPFHKFFNVNEREETQTHVLDFTQEYTIMTKLDGSFVRPISYQNRIQWASKMGVTHISEYVDEFLSGTKNINYNEFAKWCLDTKITPIFEFCSKKNKVVIDYEEDRMTLLAVRENISGKYLKIM